MIILCCYNKKQTGSYSPQYPPVCSPYKPERNSLASYYKIMITIYIKNCNPLSQNIYDNTINNLQLHTVSCTCGCKGCLIRYGSYKRTLKVMSHMFRLRVTRVLCKNCHHTHALIPSSIVPYSQIPLDDQQDIIRNAYTSNGQMKAIMEKNLLIDENTIKYILRQYRRHWKERLAAIGLSLKEELTVPCFKNYARQFMQIRSTPNILYS